MHDVMRLFIKRRDQEKYSKDFAGNACSRLRTSIRRDLGLKYVDVDEIINDDKLLNFKYKDQICLLYTALKSEMVILAKPDQLLETMMNLLVK
jgi:hypothetical protein